MCLQLKKMAQQVNRSIFTSMALRVATLFRAKCQDSVLLYEAGKPAKRELILSRKALTTQYGELPTRVESPWSDDFAPKEVGTCVPESNAPLTDLAENRSAAPSC